MLKPRDEMKVMSINRIVSVVTIACWLVVVCVVVVGCQWPRNPMEKFSGSSEERSTTITGMVDTLNFVAGRIVR